MTLDADVIVVGSGAGGGVVAAELAAAGRSVLVLEAGPFVDEATMPRTELEAFSRLYLNHGLLSTWDALDQPPRRLGGRRRDARQLDDLHRRPGRRSRRSGRASTASTASTAPSGTRTGAPIEARDRRRGLRGRPAQGRGHPARRGGPRLGGGPDPAQRDRLRRLRELPVRLPAGRRSRSGIRAHLAAAAARPARGSSIGSG